MPPLERNVNQRTRLPRTLGKESILRTALPGSTHSPVRRPPLKHSFIALRVRNYRLFVISQIVSNTAIWMQRIAQDWLVLRLTGSVTAVGITVAMQFAPLLFFGLFGGVIADRYPKRTLLIITQALSGILAAALAALTLLGVVEVWHVLVIAFGLGMVIVVDNPARQAFVSEMVGHRYLRNAISLNSSVFQLGGLVGPALSGAMIFAVGEGWSFAINAVAACFVVLMVWLMRTSELQPAPVVPRAKGQLREGLRYVRGKPEIAWTILLVGFLGMFGLNMPVLLTAFSSSVFHVGPSGLGLFSSLLALGALGGALLSTRISTIRLRSLVSYVVTFGLLQALAGYAPGRLTFSALLVGIGFMTLIFITSANSMVQLRSDPTLRGRVMALYVLVLVGSQAIGGPVIGVISEQIGPRIAMALSGLIPAVAAVVIGLVLARTGHFTVQVTLRNGFGWRVFHIVPSKAHLSA